MEGSPQAFALCNFLVPMRVDEFIQRFNALNEVLFFVAFGYNPIEKVSY